MSVLHMPLDMLLDMLLQPTPAERCCQWVSAVHYVGCCMSWSACRGVRSFELIAAWFGQPDTQVLMGLQPSFTGRCSPWVVLSVAFVAAQIASWANGHSEGRGNIVVEHMRTVELSYWRM